MSSITGNRKMSSIVASAGMAATLEGLVPRPTPTKEYLAGYRTGSRTIGEINKAKKNRAKRKNAKKARKRNRR